MSNSFVAALAGTRDWRTREWLLQDLTPMNRGEAKILEPWIGELANVHFYRCRHFDRQTRRCLDYENRPRVCTDYPWYGRPPSRATTLPETCGYRAEVGLSVKIGPKPTDWRSRMVGT